MDIISKDLNRAVQLLNAEDIIAIPTETVYGLAGNIYSEKAINRIFKTKQRPFYNPLIVHIASVNELKNIVSQVPEKAMQLAEAFWPGPMTLVLPKKPKIPSIITAGKPSVAVRVPNHELTLSLLSKLDFPLAAPSANPFSSISPTKPEHVERYFKSDIKMILDGGPCQKGIESTIIGVENDKPIIYRLGSTPIENIEAIVGNIEIKNHKEKAPNAPGMLERHYAPKTKTILTNNIYEAIETYKEKRIGLLLFSDLDHKISTYKIVLSNSKNLEEASSKLYDALHELDGQNLDIIIAEQLPNMGLGTSINDRLKRATK